MLKLDVNVMSYPELQGVMTVIGDTWVGVGVDPQGATHVLVTVDKTKGKHNSKPAEWYTLEDYPNHLKEVVEHLRTEL